MLWKGRILMFVLPFKKGSYQIFACHWKYFLKDGNVQVCALFYMVRSWCFRYSTMKWGFGQLDGLVVDLLFSKAIVLFSPQGNGEEEGNFRPIPVFTVWSSFWDGASSSSALLVVTALDLTIFPWISSSFLQPPLILKRKERTGSQDAQGSLPSFHVDKSPTKYLRLLDHGNPEVSHGGTFNMHPDLLLATGEFLAQCVNSASTQNNFVLKRETRCS